MLAGIWNEWVDPETGELVPSYSMLTINCDNHPLLRRLHKPDPKLPENAQDKRAVVHIQHDDWSRWLAGDELAAKSLLRAPPSEFYNQGDAVATDALLTALF